MKNLAGFIVFFLMTLAAARFGAQFGTGEWYAAIEKPSWTPPNWVFGPVWIILYLIMPIPAWLVWRERARALVWPALAVYTLQLVLNALWSMFFFGWNRIGLALVDILALEALILATVILFWRIRPLAGALLLPYLAWVGFASALNFEIWRLNL